ncbi:hypothetical protein SAMN04488109_1803 [Chryseolinea serpens]|uniref:Uncharacterized protein n=1 Tax=Chryseolinea serpens TaxID=947013 RepID=A0A1M5ML01_9BACT|nr:hypothetical protein [Chryseolinea serpens]SHG78060.1 hypothetical protein SAMN04488109_1803 [Chryseolinea serpens]
MNRISLKILVLLFLLVSCGKKKATYLELQKFVADPAHGLVQSKNIQGVKIDVYYRPTDLLVHQEIGKARSASDSTIAKLRQKYSAYEYFVLSLSKGRKEITQVEGPWDRGQIIQALSFEMSRFVKMTSMGRDSIPVSDYTIVRTFGLGNSTDALFAFEKPLGDTKWIQFSMDEFGLGIGRQEFRFSTRNIDAVPKLNFND